ncbi:leucine-rich repeat extensin-like protein 5 [Fundulus heteroclitus]|uniref:leucine-rich repeat extensin-like protein 5 n=1 Tax=Fundulus heteroclitus TaxID=8078 RepID=UPI00165B1730|nr:leucine-rich repeat extensin-like protein 5 [Fundulus heteroclitus]
MEYHSGGSLPLLGRPRYCPGAKANGGYLCETGHCCGETGCCTYYYELWWFWLLWTVLILFSCCCAYRHRRAKLRVQQQQRQREISLLAYHGANSFPSSMLDLSFLASLKLPSYEEVAAQPSTPPPPYSSVFTTPRYPQPPRATDPHLLTQHGPLLHRPLSDGPSSFSSDNSSSCSCDSCCPSSPCSSSLSAPITYETDTSHASTPSEATPLTLDVTMETIAAAASCLEANEARFAPERAAATVAVDIEDDEHVRAQEPPATDSSTPIQTVTIAVVNRAASPQPSPGSEISLADAASSPINVQLDMPPSSTIFSTGSSSTLPSPRLDTIHIPSIKIMRTGSLSGSSTPTVNAYESCGQVEGLETRDLSQTFDPPSVPSSPSVPSPNVHRTMAFKADSASLLTSDQDLSIVQDDASVTPTQTTVPTNLTKDQVPLLSDLTSVPPNPPTIIVPDCIITPPLIPKPTHLNLTPGLITAPVSSPLTQNLEPLSGSPAPLVQIPSSPGSGLPGSVVSSIVLALSADNSGPSPGLHESNLLSPLPSDVQASFSSGSGSGSPTFIPTLSCPVPVNISSSCPAITIESETFVSSQSPLAVVSPSSPRSPPCPTAPALLLDPLTALQQPDKVGCSSGHASSLSPSPRATQSPPKQTVFSPCVDVFEPGPACWEDGEEEQDDRDKEEDEDDDMGADESQYRHRRLTGDSGIEVCRCRVEEEDDDEEDEEVETDGNIDVHDSADCPARSQVSTGDELTPCNPSTSVTTTTPEENGKVIIVMEKV